MKATYFAAALLSFACLLPANGVARAQGAATSGEIRGMVTDATGATVPKATVAIEDAEKGVRRTAVTETDGEYRVTGLPPASYSVTVETSGFQKEIRKDVVLSIGQTLILDFHLQVASATAQVEVTGELPVVETERGSQADTLSQVFIANLPIDRRDYLAFTLLTPGVSNSTRLASDQDYRVKQTPQSGLSFYGSNGRGNSVTVDGGEANDDSGGVRLTLSQDAVQEFQVNRSNYSADLGGASGAAINIVSKSGTNDMHGSLYGYFRNSAMDAADPFAITQALQPGETFDPSQPNSVGQPTKNSLDRYQYGGTTGFPIQKDKSFLFLSFEGLQQDSQTAVPILTTTQVLRPNSSQQTVLNELTGNGTVPCLSGPVGAAVAQSLGLPAPNPTTNLPASECSAILNGALTLNPAASQLQAFLLNQLETNGGLFNYKTREYLASGRFDHRFSESNQLTATYRFGHDLEENPDVQSLTGFSAGSSIHDYDNNAFVAWYHQFSTTAQNEAFAQFDYTSFNVIPNEPGEVGLQIPGVVNNLGTSIFIPNLTITRRYEFGDNFTLIRGHHTMKFGGSELLRGNHTESHTFFPGRFIFGSLPGDLITPLLPSIDPLQAASFGLPQVFQQGFGDPTYPYYTRPFTALYWQDSWKIRSNFTLNYGLRYELDSQFAPLNTYSKDFGPRVSFAWDPFKDHKTVVRGGYGIFYAPIYAQIPDVDYSLGVLNANKSSVGNTTLAGQVNNLDAICGMSGAFGLFPGNGSSPCNREISIYIIPITGVPGGNPALNAPTVFQTLFAQGAISCTIPAPGSYACITPNGGPGGVGGLSQFGLRVANTGQLSPLQVVFVNQPNFRPPYAQQAEFGIEREIAPGFSISASYIYSHTIGLPTAIDTNLLPAPMSTVTLANGKNYSYRNWNTTAAGADPLGGAEGLPCDASQGFACFVNPFIVQNNEYASVGSALYQAGILEVQKRFSDHFTMFGNYTYSKGYDTGTDFNSDYGPQDPTNLGADRALSEFDQRNKVVVAGVFDSPWKNPILAAFQLAPIFTYNSGHPFNLLAGGEVNGDNHTTNERPIGAGRDTGIGPDYTNLDLRLSWHHKLVEKANLQFTAEVFNLANHTNYASVNNEVSPLFGLPSNAADNTACPACPVGLGNTTFHVHGSAALSPSQPLGFTSDFPKREIQLGLRLTF
ncbi:MAG TPA: TonB-dependent receptor [Candidatus Acidoferrum sp.]|nr:TonB-dependent receptor [Candidatus Acidoferrum sp.]